nr:transposase [Flavobacterium aestivum]
MYRFKLHIVINTKGEILSFTISQANVYDRELFEDGNFLIAILESYFQATYLIINKLNAII